MTRRLIVAAIALLIAAQVVRIAAVDAWSRARPAAAARVWAGHPDVELSSGMTAIAEAAREGTPVTAETFRRIDDAAAKAPLAPEPFLVRGVQAQLAGEGKAAEQAFLAAEWRDPRSLPARYFLADHYFREGDARRGLREIGALASLTPGGVGKLAPYVAAFAHDRANWPQVRALFRSKPALEDATLIALSAKAENADTVMALADPHRRGAASAWLPGLLATLTSAGQTARARRIWAAMSGVSVRPDALFDPQFANPGPPPPFNWSLTSSTVGFAERQRGGGLHVIFYGQEDGVLASQTLVLPAGRYRLSLTGPGGTKNADSLQWTIVCTAINRPIDSTPLNAVADRGWSFVVPASCPAQRLELAGSSVDVPQQADVTIRGLSLVREGQGA
ncbi:MAG: hypothetical protein ACJ8FL_00840 [Sphingomicrobium sp.]